MSTQQETGHFVCYRPRKFQGDALETLKTANVILEEYEKRQMPMTLRQLYYQMVARGFIENSKTSYNKLGNLISDGRMAGLVSWTSLEDRGRNLQGYETFVGPEEAVLSAAENYKMDLWADQPFRLEVWVEKDALRGVIGTICNQHRVDFFSCRGYNSQSEQWRAGRRFAGYVMKGQRPIVLHLGDHDPSGIDMTRDNIERLSLFAGTPIQVIRLALNMDQIEELNPPPNPAKVDDPRATDYIRQYGESSWELDALDPAYIHKLIGDTVRSFRDDAKWDVSLKQEAEDRDEIQMMTEN